MSGDRTFYQVPFQDVIYTWPRVTEILSIIDKSRPLIGWAVNHTNAAWKLRLEDVLTDPKIEHTPQAIHDSVMAGMAQAKAHVRAKEEAAEIGGAAHDLIRWHTLAMMGQDPGPEPKVGDASLRAVLAWLDWTKVVGFKPRYAEMMLFCPYCGYAGTCDTIAEVHSRLTVVDYKTAPPPKKDRPRVYREALWQVNFYQHAAIVRGIQVTDRMVVRLPKVDGDTWTPEDAVSAPQIPSRNLRALLASWRTNRWLDGESYGSEPVGPHPDSIGT